MSSGGGIARFASRKPASSTGDTSAPTSSENAATKFSFSFNGNNDALSVTSDDEFGFLGGGGNSIGGDYFFMMNDGGFNHERDTFDESNGDSTMNTENASVNNGGIACFSGRTVTVPSIASTTVQQQGKIVDEVEPVPNSSPNFLMPPPQTVVCENHAVVNTRVITAPNSTPDGRILPMPLYQSVVTPHTSTTTLIEQYESSEDGFPSTPIDRCTESPAVGNALRTMGPPPNRHATAMVTPAEDILKAQISKQSNGTTATKLFANEPLPSSTGANSDVSCGGTQTFTSDESSVAVNDRSGRTCDDTSSLNGVNTEDFHQNHQKFITMIRDLHDMEKKLQDMMFDGSLHVDVAAALLLQMKCHMYDVTDQIFEQLGTVNVALHEFLPHSLEQE